MDVKIEAGWKSRLQGEFDKPYFKEIVRLIRAERAAGKTIYPPGGLIFNAFDSTPFDKVRVVIIGQDPYHGPGQAHGLCFSVGRGVRPPPSLVNIFKEISDDLGIRLDMRNGDLTGWAHQGVLLLNAALTVRQHEPMSHARIGWHTFTDAVIGAVSEHRKGVVFLLWGRFAQEKEQLIDLRHHHILKAAHPSPYSADKGFFGCRHFSKTNELLMQAGSQPIDWNPSTNTGGGEDALS